MSAVITVGPPGPAPPATGTSPASAPGTDGAAPFAAVLNGTGQTAPVPTSANGEPPGPDPGSLDTATLIQLLLGGEPPTGDRTETDIASQLDRAAGAGSGEIAEAGLTVDGELLAAFASQPIPAAEPLPQALAGIVLAPTVTDRPLGVRGRSLSANPALPEAAAEVAQGVGVRAADEGVAPVILPSAAAGARRSDASPVIVAEGEQQHALPLAQASIDVEAPAPISAPTIEAQPVAEAPVTELQQPIADLPAALPDELKLAPVVESEEPALARPEPEVRTAEATAEAAVAVAREPVTSSTRSTPVTATEPAATPAPEAFSADLANTVRRASLLGDQEVRLLLNPPELGHLDIRIVESPGGLRVVLEATTAEARELIEQQLPMLRSALEARDLRVERLAVEQALDASAAERESDRGLRQDGQGSDGSEQSGQDEAPWSPVASLQSEQPGQPADAGAGSSGSELESRTTVNDGRLNVLA